MRKQVRIARARVRQDVHNYFAEHGGHGAIDAGDVVDSTRDADDHVERMLQAAEERGVDLADWHDLEEDTLRTAIEIEICAVIDQEISNVEEMEAETA